MPVCKGRAVRTHTGRPGPVRAGADTGPVTNEPQRGRWTPGLIGGAFVAVALAVIAFVVLDVVVAVAAAVVLATGVVVAVLVSDWDQHSSYEERELERSRRRKDKWEQNKDARERDRRRWEEHQARQSGSDS